MPHPGSNYWRGAAAGLAAGVLAAAIALHRGWAELLGSVELPNASAAPATTPGGGLGAWVETNLGSSWIPFSVIGILYGTSLLGARQRLRAWSDAPHGWTSSVGTLQLWSSTFFGIGVLWTAVGMRGAMIYSLGDLGPAGPAGTTAFELMNRLVNGGVLTALTTTIVGGAGSYLMNVLTQLYVVLPSQRTAARLRAIEVRRLHQALERISTGTTTPVHDGTEARHPES
jgi:hypothetical protein